jgi:hypothetical protein
MIRLSALATALALAFPLAIPAAHASDDLGALRAEVAAMKAAYEARIAALEARLAVAETSPAVTPAATASLAQSAAPEAVVTEPAVMEPAPRSAAAARGFNPDVSLILQGRYAHLEDRAERGVSGFFPAGGHAHGGESARGFALDGSELVLSASVDPTFRGYMNAVFADDTVEVEEAWFQTSALGNGLAVKGGRFRSGVGYQNEQHPHAWDFATNNLAYDVLWGEGYAQEGLQVKWLAPTELFVEFGAEAGRGGSFPSTARDDNGFSSVALFGHVGGDVGESNSWRAGLSWLAARPKARAFDSHDLTEIEVAGEFAGKSRTWLADFVWKWAPDGNPAERNFKFAAEYFQRDESGELACAPHDIGDVSLYCDGTAQAFASEQSGFYAQGVYQFMPRWRVGLRLDQLYRGRVRYAGADAADAFEPFADHDPRRVSLMLDFNPSEFSRLRLQFTRDDAQAGFSENQLYVQYIMSLGSHGAHKF